MTSIATVVRQLREQVFHGACIDLVPYAAEYAADVVRLRNLPGVRHFLNQQQESTLEAQLAWTAGYQQRDNDVFWIIKDKAGHVVGCNRLYDITPESAEKGSQIADPDFAMTLPVALEADLRVIQIAFNELEVARVIFHARNDNQKVHSMNARFGFVETGREDIRGVPYLIGSLDRGSFCPEPFESILNHWSRRHERRKT